MNVLKEMIMPCIVQVNFVCVCPGIFLFFSFFCLDIFIVTVYACFFFVFRSIYVPYVSWFFLTKQMKIFCFPKLSLLAVLDDKIYRNSLHTLCVTNTYRIFCSYYHDDYIQISCYMYKEKVKRKVRIKFYSNIFEIKMNIIT